MIDVDEINKLIEDKRSFRIGGRGICIDCRFHFPSRTWVVDVPRASLEMHCESISVCDDVEFTVLECTITMTGIVPGSSISVNIQR